MKRSAILLALIFAVALPVHAATLEEKIQEAMASVHRDDAEKERDDNRKPLETLAFFQMRDDMNVLELLPGGGWYTKILAPVLRENGALYVSIGTDRVRDTFLKEDGFGHVTVLETGATLPPDGPFNTRDISDFEFGVTGIDLALTFRNMHNFTPEARAKINAAVYDSLKPGGLYGVVDHSRRHMAPITEESRRRADVVQIIKEALASGFEFVDYSDLHYRPDDELRYEVGRKSVTGNTDRFTLLFRRPE